MDKAARYIPEADYVQDLDGVLHSLARMIATSGLTISQIARGTRMKWSTVYNASQGIPVRLESYARIRYYLSHTNHEKAPN